MLALERSSKRWQASLTQHQHAPAAGRQHHVERMALAALQRGLRVDRRGFEAHHSSILERRSKKMLPPDRN